MRCYINLANNPIAPHNNPEQHTVAAGGTVRQWLDTRGITEFAQPTICTLNGTPLMRDQWTRYQLQHDDVVWFVPVLGDPVSIVIGVVLAVGAYFYAKSLVPDLSDDHTEGDSVHTLKGQNNQVKLLDPIERPYGRCRVWPSYAAQPFTSYANNDEYLYQLLCIGHGEYEIKQLYVEDTPIENFDEVEYEVVPPGNLPTLFPLNVITSSEVKGIELYGSNEEDYTGASGPFVVNDANTHITKIEVDVGLPRGLYHTKKKGGLGEQTVTALFEYRSIDDTGAPKGSWAVLANLRYTLWDIQPHFFTLSRVVPAGRYEVRAVRTNEASDSHTVGDTLQWVAMRGFVPHDDKTDFGNVTLLAVKAKATNNLNDNASHKVNAVVTAKIPVYDVGTKKWTTQATRSIAWAFCDVFMNRYGGNMAASYLDLPTLAALDAKWQKQGRFFDHVFDQKVSVWDAAKTIARMGRGVPVLQGSQITLVEDVPKTLPEAVFTPYNMIKDSFQWDIELYRGDAHDCVELTYTDATTWKKETLTCIPTDSPALNPKSITLDGCTNRDIAYQEGMYSAMNLWLNRESVTFETGLEGYIPTYGALISVAHDLPEWGQSAQVVRQEGTVLTLSEPMQWEANQQHYVLLRDTDGSGVGPLKVTQGDTPNVVVLAGWPANLTLHLDGHHERPMVQFGVADSYSQRFKVTDITPQGDDRVQIQAIAYTDALFKHDSDTATPLPDMQLGGLKPSTPPLPTVNGLRWRTQAYVDGVLEMTQGTLSWTPTSGARHYVVQQSSDGQNYTTVATPQSSSAELTIVAGATYFRVAAVGVAQGPWAYWSGKLKKPSEALANVTGLAVMVPFTGQYVQIKWEAVAKAEGYYIDVIMGGVTIKTIATTNTSMTYNHADAVADVAATDGINALSRNITFSVIAANRDTQSLKACVLHTSNPAPATPTGIHHQVVRQTNNSATYRLYWNTAIEADVAGYKVWGSTTGATLGSDATLLYDGNDTQHEVTINKPSAAGSHPPTQFTYQVAAYDVWGRNIAELNVSAKKSIVVGR